MSTRRAPLSGLSASVELSDDASVSVVTEVRAGGDLGIAVVTDGTVPTADSAATTDSTHVAITCSEALDTTVIPAAGSFAFTTNGTARTVTSVAIADAVITLTLSGAISTGNTISIDYTKPATNSARDVRGNQLATFTGLGIVNNV